MPRASDARHRLVGWRGGTRATRAAEPPGGLRRPQVRSQPAGAPAGRLTLAVIGVEPGDAIEFADPTPPSAALGCMTIEFTAHPGAASYRVENGCGAAFPTTNTTPLEFEDACVRGGEVDILIRAADDGGALLGWLGGSGTFNAGDPGGRAPDAQLVSTIWIEEGEVSESGIYLLAPPDLTEVELPALPDGYAEYAPIDPGDIDVQVIGAESSRFDGYRAARQRGFEIVRDDAVLLGEPPIASALSGGPNAEL